MNRQEKDRRSLFLIAEAFRLNHVPFGSPPISVFDTLVVNVLKDYTEDDYRHLPVLRLRL